MSTLGSENEQVATSALKTGEDELRGMLRKGPMLDQLEFLRRLYERFNARDIEGALAGMQHDVIWANGMEGGHVHGRDQVRSYWTRQWAMIDPRVDPVEFSSRPEGEIVVEVHQVVRDLNGNLLSDRTVGHVFQIENGLIKRFDIRA